MLLFEIIFESIVTFADIATSESELKLSDRQKQ